MSEFDSSWSPVIARSSLRHVGSRVDSEYGHVCVALSWHVLCSIGSSKRSLFWDRH